MANQYTNPKIKDSNAKDRDYELLFKKIFNDDGELTASGQLLIDKAMEQIAKGDSEMIRFFIEKVIK